MTTDSRHLRIPDARRPPQRHEVENRPRGCTGTSAQDANKRLAQLVLDELYNRRNLAAADEYLAPDVTFNTFTERETQRGLEAYKRWADAVTAGFELRLSFAEVIAEGDRVSLCVFVQGRHTGEYRGMPPTQRRVSYWQLITCRIADGKLIEIRQAIDVLGIVRQLGFFPQGDMPRAVAVVIAFIHRVGDRRRRGAPKRRESGA